ALCAIHLNAFDRGSIGLDVNMRVVVCDAVNGGGVVERLFWLFAGNVMALRQMKVIYRGDRFVDWLNREVFRGG
ncbi:phosphorothioated DNA-binding restriction endonuclease, partial [Salmonella enterica]